MVFSIGFPMKMKVLFYLSTLIIVCIFYSCSGSNPEQDREMKIQLPDTEIKFGVPVSFALQNVDLSKVNCIYWDFGDGGFSNDISPSYTYHLPGDFMVKATVTMSSGEKKTSQVTLSVIADEISSDIRPSIPEAVHKYQVCAHRGYWKDAPENSILAIEEAIEAGLDYIEIDVRMTADGKLILMHNSTIDETTNGTGKVADLKYNEILSYSLYYDGQLTTEKVPTLTEALMAARGKIFVDIDVKISDFKGVYEIVKKCGMLSQSMFSVYEISDAARLMNISDDIIVFPSVYSLEELEDYSSRIKDLAIVQCNVKNGREKIVEEATQRNIAVFMNVYVNSDKTPESDGYKDVNEFIRIGGTIVQTDFPVELKKYLDNYN